MNIFASRFVSNGNGGPFCSFSTSAEVKYAQCFVASIDNRITSFEEITQGEHFVGRVEISKQSWCFRGYFLANTISKKYRCFKKKGKEITKKKKKGNNSFKFIAFLGSSSRISKFGKGMKWNLLRKRIPGIGFEKSLDHSTLPDIDTQFPKLQQNMDHKGYSTNGNLKRNVTEMVKGEELACGETMWTGFHSVRGKRMGGYEKKKMVLKRHWRAREEKGLWVCFFFFFFFQCVQEY